MILKSALITGVTVDRARRKVSVSGTEIPVLGTSKDKEASSIFESFASSPMLSSLRSRSGIFPWSNDGRTNWSRGPSCWKVVLI